MTVTSGRIVVIGMGNPLRGDDGVGLVVARKLETAVPSRVEVRTHVDNDLALMDAWKGAEAVVVVDAVSSGAPAGAVSRYDAGDRPLPRPGTAAGSTHGFGLNEVVELARAMDSLPGRFVIIGVEGTDFTTGRGLSPAVGEAVEEAVEAVLRELDSLTGPNRPESRRQHA